jgi:mRNA interferase MazF
MRRGEIWTVAGGPAYAGKPRLAVIVQDDRFDANDSIVVCPLTTDPTSAPIFRLPIPSNTRTGLRAPCRLMVDKVTAVPRKRLGTLVGTLNPDELKGLNRAIFVFLGLSETDAPQP